MVHPELACAGLEKSGHADSTWSCVNGLQTGRSACPPACCIMPSASAATTTSAPTITDGQVIFTIDQDPEDCRCSACGSREVISRGHVERRFRILPIGSRATFVVLPIPRVECRACGAGPSGRGPLRRPQAELHQVLRAIRPGAVAEHDHPRCGPSPRRRLGPDQGHPEARPVAALRQAQAQAPPAPSPSTRSPSPRGTAT